METRGVRRELGVPFQIAQIGVCNSAGKVVRIAEMGTREGRIDGF